MAIRQNFESAFVAVLMGSVQKDSRLTRLLHAPGWTDTWPENPAKNEEKTVCVAYKIEI
jgi:hypothetical protein